MYTYLIVDDEMIERKGIRMLLSRMNIRENILEASNGEEALEVFEKEKIDVLLTDINMPFMDGIELLSRIHDCLLYTSPSPRDAHESRMPSSA